MALTLVSSPAYIDNTAAFNITTSLVEDADHVNLRVRADVYHEGIVKAIVEKPKGLADFDFGDILKSLTPGLKFARDSGEYLKTGTVGTNLIIGWSVHVGTFDELTTSGNTITRALKAADADTFAKTNEIAVTIGELYVFYSPDFATAGALWPYTNMSSTTIVKHATGFSVYKNKGLIIMISETGNLQIYIGRYNGQFDFSGNFYLHKITTNRTTIGNPLAPYFSFFTEVFENINGVTTTGATKTVGIRRHVPAPGDGTVFSNYVLTGTASRFANKTLRNNITKFFTVNPAEYWLSFFTEYQQIRVRLSKDGAAFATAAICSENEGWGVIILNIGEMFLNVTNNIRILIEDTGAGNAAYSETITIYVDTSNIAERVVLEYDGLVGGKEYLVFEGLKSIEFDTIRNYYSGSKKAKKALSLTGINKQTLETRFKDIANTDYLKSLLVSEDVKKLLPAYAAPTPVTILTENVKIESSEMFTNQIDIEYEY